MKMDENFIILVDDDKSFENEFKNKIAENNIGSKLLYFKNTEDLSSSLTSIKNESIKFLIFDLCTAPGETESKVFSIKPIIKNFYESQRIIIFIHSAYIHNFDDYPTEGTLFKIEKDARSIDSICQRIKTFESSNFHNIFSLNGAIERSFMQQLHTAFRTQFRGEEILEIIHSIYQAYKEEAPRRVEEVFQRIAVKCLYQNLYNATSISKEDSSIEEVNINAIENYYFRTSDYKYWTGDIFKNVENDEFVVVQNPRCNISNGKIHHLIFCNILPFTPDQLKAFLKEDNLRKGLNDDVKSSNIGDRYRFLPKTTKFRGGLIDFNTLSSLQPEVFLKRYRLTVSISDDLTNDIIRKFTSYLVRGGVYITETKEALYYLTSNGES